MLTLWTLPHCLVSLEMIKSHTNKYLFFLELKWPDLQSIVKYLYTTKLSDQFSKCSRKTYFSSYLEFTNIRWNSKLSFHPHDRLYFVFSFCCELRYIYVCMVKTLTKWFLWLHRIIWWREAIPWTLMVTLFIWLVNWMVRWLIG